MKVYLAGPITGVPDYQERFAAAAELLCAQGHQVIDPTAGNGCQKRPCTRPGYTWRDQDTPEGAKHSWQCWMREGIRSMLACDQVAILPGWEQSRGALLERSLALKLGLTVVYLPPSTPTTLTAARAHLRRPAG